jgi:hypothetical protein
MYGGGGNIGDWSDNLAALSRELADFRAGGANDRAGAYGT